MPQQWHGPILNSATFCFHTSHLYIAYLSWYYFAKLFLDCLSHTFMWVVVINEKLSFAVNIVVWTPTHTISFFEVFSSKSPNLIHDHWYFSNPNVLYYASFFSMSYCCITLIELILFMLYDKMILYDEMSVFVQKMYLIIIKFVLIPYYFHLLLLF